MRRGGEGRPREGGGAGAQSPVAQSQPMAPMGRLTVSDPQNGMMVRRIGHYCERRVEMGRCGDRSNAQPRWRSCRLIIIAPSRLGTTSYYYWEHGSMRSSHYQQGTSMRRSAAIGLLFLLHPDVALVEVRVSSSQKLRRMGHRSIGNRDRS